MIRRRRFRSTVTVPDRAMRDESELVPIPVTEDPFIEVLWFVDDAILRLMAGMP